MTTDEKIVVREFLFGEDDAYTMASVAGVIEKYSFDDNGDVWHDLSFKINDGVDHIAIEFTVGGENATTDAIRAKKTLDKVACVLRTLREKLNELAYPETKE